MKNKILFKLEWKDYDDCIYYLFIHFDKTKKQFIKDINFLLHKYGEDYLAQEEGFAGADNWITFISKKMSELNYLLVIPITNSFFGTYIIESNEKNNRKWRNIVGKELLNKVILHNKKKKEEMNEIIAG